jgi:hypothetical protein
MSIVSGICGKCKKYYSGGWCPGCEKIDVDKTLNFITDFHDSYYDAGLGEVVKSRQHRKELMREKGLEEVGNERAYVDPAKNYRDRERKIEAQLKNIEREAYRAL